MKTILRLVAVAAILFASPVDAFMRGGLTVVSSSGHSDSDWPDTPGTRPTITSGNPATGAGAVLSWVGPSGGGPNNGNPVQQSVTLPAASGPRTISASGTYSGLNLFDTLTITASNVTIQHSYINSAGGFNVIAINAAGVQNVVIEDCEIVGGGATSGVAGQSGIFIINNLGSGGVTVRRNHIFAVGDGISVGDAPYTVSDNYIHDIDGDPSTHFNGMQDNGHTNHDGQPVLIQHNVINNNLQNETDALMLTNLGPNTNVSVLNNKFLGAGLTSAGVVYVDGSSGTPPMSVTFNNNVVGPSSNAANTTVFSRTGAASSYTLNHTGNTNATTGANIDGNF